MVGRYYGIPGLLILVGVDFCYNKGILGSPSSYGYIINAHIVTEKHATLLRHIKERIPRLDDGVNTEGN